MTQQDADHGVSQQYGSRKDNSKVSYASQEMERNVANEPVDNSRYEPLLLTKYIWLSIFLTFLVIFPFEFGLIL